MSPERWKQIEDLCQAALARPPAERAAFLDRACAGDTDLQAEVERLLSVEETAFFLDEPLVPPVDALDDDVLLEDERIGAYRIVQAVGRGGMGTVYLAERDDGAFRQQVALKLLRRGLDTDDLLRRFRTERQILASLNHPNIARLLDGGATADGRPYLVMEFVEGLPITAYCDRHRLGVEARLRLFRQVCAAVHYAHQNLVVHRDLKPSNMLVTEEGVPKLLDFGIAKLLAPEQTGLSVPMTRTEMRLLTPEYASPEQVRGGTITTASDVYALGVLLYELLTGRRPYRLSSRVHQEIERVICEEEPVRPSTAVTQVEGFDASDPTAQAITPERVSKARATQVERLQKRLAGDLDNIVLMAMRKDPPRRYTSADQLSEDIHRHLEGLPVAARPDTLSYRMQKFVRRHRAGVASAAVLVTVLLAFAVVTTIQAAQIRMRAEAAVREQQKAEEVAAFLEELFEASDPYEEVRGDTLTARALLERGRTRIEGDLSAEPEVQAQMMVVMARVYERLGLYDDGELLARQALERRRHVYGEEHPAVAESISQLAFFLRRKGDYETAEQLYRQSLAMRRKLLGNEHLDVSRSLGELATVLMRQDNYEAAEPLFRESLAMDRKLLGEDHLDVAVSLNDLALVLHYRGAYEEAASLYREALASYRRTVGEEHPEVATTLHNLAVLLRDQGDFEAADSLERQALALRRSMLGDDHMLVANSLGTLASVLKAKGAYAEAVPLYHEALDILRKALPVEHPRTAIMLVGLGFVLTEQGLPEQAEPLLREALASRSAAYGDTDWRTAEAKTVLGACLAALQRYDEATPLLQDGHTALSAHLGPEHRLTVQAQEALAQLTSATAPGPLRPVQR